MCKYISFLLQKQGKNLCLECSTGHELEPSWGDSGGQRSLVGYSLWGRRVGHDLRDWTTKTTAYGCFSNSPRVTDISVKELSYGWNHILQPHIPSEGWWVPMGDLLSYQEVPEPFKTQPASCSFAKDSGKAVIAVKWKAEELLPL